MTTDATPDTTGLRKEGRVLASRRDDLIAEGVDPASLLVPGSIRCLHENVSTYRSHPPRSVCLDCNAEVERVWTTSEEASRG